MLVNGNILLVEGNWLLLDELELLKKRLIQRKIQGGLSEEEAVRFYETSDRLNVERIVGHTVPANEEWQMLEDRDFARLK